MGQRMRDKFPATHLLGYRCSGRRSRCGEDSIEGSLKSFQAAHPGMVQFGNPTGTHIRQSDRNFVAYIRCSFATMTNHCVDGFVERCSK